MFEEVCTVSEYKHPPQVPDIQSGGSVEVIPRVQEGLDDSLRRGEFRDYEESVRELGARHPLDGGRPDVFPPQAGPLGLGNSGEELVSTVLHN